MLALIQIHRMGRSAWRQQHQSHLMPQHFSHSNFQKLSLEQNYMDIFWLFWLSTHSCTPAISSFWNNRNEAMAGADKGHDEKHFSKCFGGSWYWLLRDWQTTRFEVRRVNVLPVRLQWESEWCSFQFRILFFFFSWWEYLVVCSPGNFQLKEDISKTGNQLYVFCDQPEKIY